MQHKMYWLKLMKLAVAMLLLVYGAQLDVRAQTSSGSGNTWFYVTVGSCPIAINVGSDASIRDAEISDANGTWIAANGYFNHGVWNSPRGGALPVKVRRGAGRAG